MNNSTLDVQHNVTLTEAQISIILYILEGYNNTSNDPDLPKELDNIFKELEGVIDSYYEVNKIWLIQTITPRIEVGEI
mgnify:FL=1